MENRNLSDLNRLFDLFSDPSLGPGFNPVRKESLTTHRRGQWFKSSTTHHISGLNSIFQLLNIMSAVLGPQERRRYSLECVTAPSTLSPHRGQNTWVVASLALQ